MTITIDTLGTDVGAQISGVDRDQLLTDDTVAATILDALETHGVLVFRDLHLDPETQVAFCRKLGPIDIEPGHHPVEGIYRVSLDTGKNSSASYLRATFDWHIDGCTPQDDAYPQMATMLSAKAVAASGGDTEFASTYKAFDNLSETEREQLAALRVVHSLEASQRLVTPDPTPEQLAAWHRRPSKEHPLIWTHKTGRKSLVLGASTDHIVGMDPVQSRQLLDDLLARCTAPDRVYRHEWSVGDTVIWDNRGVIHRATPYDSGSPREMLRTTVLGDEPIR
ncbi:TauD/TfdA dioxygenase family protein [Nocardia kruczakiae]|uniref:TauD/TfdA dioxygenase family protein n=1 Tax=Nocardia kruczakiae TaxID=261477 RepID=UPI0007A4CF39|nr:TauD/TfdA family dioxygenase [Nocardia kruczakiae]